MTTFLRTWRVVTEDFPTDWPLRHIKDEPMMFSATLAFAAEHGGPITRAFCDHLDHIGLDGVGQQVLIDSRVHMLKRGWYPCIPGWHLDDFKRGANGQPMYDALDVDTTHYLTIVGDCSRTEFLEDAEIEMPPPPEGVKVYEHFNREINRRVASRICSPVSVRAGDLIQFGTSDWHRGVAATKDGWRWFARATVGGVDRQPANEIRRQVQVYLPAVEEGW